MKKLITLLLTMALAFSFVACGNNDNDTVDNNNNGVTDNTANDVNNADNNNAMNENNDRGELAKDIDTVADYLNLKDSKNIPHESIGAKSGKEYNGGKVKLYHFNDDSAEYEKLKDGKGDFKIAAHNDGFVLVFADEKDRDEDLIKKFENIDFR